MKVWAVELVAKETRLVTASGDRELQVFKLEKYVEERVGEGGWEEERIGGEEKASGSKQGATGKRRVREEEEEHRGRVRQHSDRSRVLTNPSPSLPLQVPLTCSPVGVVHRARHERVLEMRADPSGRLLGCLVSPGHVMYGSSHLTCHILCLLKSASCLELFLVRSEEERQRVLKKKRRKAHKRTKQEMEGEGVGEGEGWVQI